MRSTLKRIIPRVPDDIATDTAIVEWLSSRIGFNFAKEDGARWQFEGYAAWDVSQNRYEVTLVATIKVLFFGETRCKSGEIEITCFDGYESFDIALIASGDYIPILHHEPMIDDSGTLSYWIGGMWGGSPFDRMLTYLRETRAKLDREINSSKVPKNGWKVV